MQELEWNQSSQNSLNEWCDHLQVFECQKIYQNTLSDQTFTSILTGAISSNDNLSKWREIPLNSQKSTTIFENSGSMLLHLYT